MWLIKNGGETGIEPRKRVAPLPVSRPVLSTAQPSLLDKVLLLKIYNLTIKWSIYLVLFNSTKFYQAKILTKVYY